MTEQSLGRLKPGFREADDRAEGWAYDPSGQLVPVADALEASADDHQDDRPHAVDVTALRTVAGETYPHVVQDLMPVQGIIAVAGEEGDGKTTLADQIQREILLGREVLGLFPCGEARPRSALFIDTEQEQAEAARRNAEMQDRGLAVAPGQLAWLNAGGIDLRLREDQDYIVEELGRTGADLLWIDSGTNAVEDPKDDVQVRHLFNVLTRLFREKKLLAIGLTLHPRKRAQGEHGRRFDDLFGSREWKGRVTKALYIEGDRIVCWKDRGGELRRRWPLDRSGRYPAATLERPGVGDLGAVPFVVREDAPVAFDREAEEARALVLVAEQPGLFTKTALAEHLGGRREDALSIVGGLLARGAIGPDQPRARLHLIGSEGSEARLL